MKPSPGAFRLCLLSLAFLLPLSPLTAAGPVGGTITGKATIELRIDKNQILSGIEIALCPESLAPKIKEVRDETWQNKASAFHYGDGYQYLDLQTIGFTAVKGAIARTKADQSGVFTFKDVAPGQYRLYAQYKSRYAAGYWLIPVEIKKAGETVTVDINNENFAEVYNRKPQ